MTLSTMTLLNTLCLCVCAAVGSGDRHTGAFQCDSRHSDQPAGHKRQHPRIHIRVLHRQGS